MGEEEVRLTKINLNWPEDKTFYVPEEVSELFSSLQDQFSKYEEDWNKLFTEYSVKYPEDARKFTAVMGGDYGDQWKSKLPLFEDDGKKLATRSVSGKVINAIASSSANSYRRFC